MVPITVTVRSTEFAKKLEKLASQFGDDTRQAVARLGVQFAREQADSTQAFSRAQRGAKSNPGRKAQLAQLNQIEVGVNQVSIAAEKWKAHRNGTVSVFSAYTRQWMTVQSAMWTESPDTLNDYVEQNRTRRRGRTPKLPFSKRMAAPVKVVKAVIKSRQKKAGIAKGGWIDAGKDAARMQRGGDRIAIGKNFLPWAQRHQKRGSATMTGGKFNPIIALTNNVSYVSDPNVLSPSQTAGNVKWAVIKTMNWYRAALRRRFKAAR